MGFNDFSTCYRGGVMTVKRWFNDLFEGFVSVGLITSGLLDGSLF